MTDVFCYKFSEYFRFLVMVVTSFAIPGIPFGCYSLGFLAAPAGWGAAIAGTIVLYPCVIVVAGFIALLFRINDNLERIAYTVVKIKT